MTALNVIAHGRYQLQRHGWSALLGLALLVFAVAAQFLGVDPVREDTAQLRAHAVAQRRQDAQRPTQMDASAKQVADFYAGLPADSQALDAIALIHQSARQGGVKLATGEYRQVREGSNALLRYQFTLPARASYASLRVWLDDVMNRLPTAALDEISFHRDDVGSDSVDARVLLTLFVRAP